MATDRETLVNTLTQGVNFPAEGGLVPPGIAGHVPGKALPYEPALVHQILAEAGFPGGQGFPSVEGLGSGIPRIKVLEGLAAGWKTNLGLQVSIEQPKSFDEFNELLGGDPPNMWLMGWAADYPDPDSFLRISSWLRRTGWHNGQYEALFQDARRIADQQQRMAMYRQAEQILVTEAPIVPISYFRLHVLVKLWLPALPASMIDGNILKDIIIEGH